MQTPRPVRAGPGRVLGLPAGGSAWALPKAPGNRGRGPCLPGTDLLSGKVHSTGTAPHMPIPAAGHAHTRTHPWAPARTRTSATSTGRGVSHLLSHGAGIAYSARRSLWPVSAWSPGGSSGAGGPRGALRGRRTTEYRQNANCNQSGSEPPRTARWACPGHTYHLTHVPCLALLSGRSRQALGTGTQQKLTGQRCATPIPMELSRSPPRRQAGLQGPPAKRGASPTMPGLRAAGNR